MSHVVNQSEKKTISFGGTLSQTKKLFFFSPKHDVKLCFIGGYLGDLEPV